VRLELANVSKAFGASPVLSNIDLQIGKGEVVALLGDNGAGKSTLIKIISGFHAPSSGSLTWEGQKVDFANFSPRRAQAMGIQTVHQHLGLVEKLSIARNFFLGREPKKRSLGLRMLDTKLMKSVVMSQLERMKVSRKLKPETAIADLSGGERQALAIARACYFGARLLILDEPTSALSINQTEQVLNIIRDAKKQGISVVFITHTLHHIREIVDTAIILRKGIVTAKLNAPLDERECARLISGA